MRLITDLKPVKTNPAQKIRRVFYSRGELTRVGETVRTSAITVLAVLILEVVAMVVLKF